MNTLKKRPVSIFLALVLCAFATLVYAEVARQGYQTTRGTVGADESTNKGPKRLFTNAGPVTSAGWTSPTTPLYTRGNPKIGLHLTSSSFAADVVQITCGKYHRDPDGNYYFLGIADIKTVTFSADKEVAAGTYSIEDNIEFETQGASVIDIRITGTAPTGQINGWVWGYGVDPTLTTPAD